MGLALFGNQWVAATYIGTVGDVVPQQLAGRVNGIAGLGDNGAALLAVLYTGVIVDKLRMDAGVPRRRDAAVPRDAERVPGAAEDRAGEVRFPWGQVLNTDACFTKRSGAQESRRSRVVVMLTFEAGDLEFHFGG